MTPLPIAKVAVISIILFCNALIASSLLPFIAFFVADFGFPPHEVARYSGYLVASFMFGQFVMSYVWGRLSDRFGRRPILLIGLTGTAGCMLGFGFSTSYSMALGFRLATGAVNGIIGVTKTYLAEITDETNQAKGFSVLGFNKALGLIVGPVIGGFLAQPAKKFPSIFIPGSLFDRYPYALPTMITFVIGMIGLIAAFFVLEESKPDIRNEEEKPLLQEELLGETCSTFSDEPMNSDEQGTFTDSLDEDASILRILSDPSIFSAISLYGMIQSYYIMYDESFALWARLTPKEGGIGWGSSQLGSAFSFGGILLLFYQTFVYHKIEKWLGPLKSFESGILLSIPSFIILPRTNMLLPAGLEDADTFNSETWFIWVLIFLCQAMRTCSALQAYTSCFIIICNSSTNSVRGTVNGIAQSVGSFFMMIGPMIAGTLFSFSQEDFENPVINWIISVHLVFNVMVCGAVITFVYCRTRIPRTLDKRREVLE